MPIPEFFKYDVRVRERMLKRGILTDAELGKHVDALADVTDQVIEVELKQPALQKESEREARIVSRSAPRPVIAHVPVVRSLENELNDIDDDEDDDIDDEEDDEDEVKVKAAAKVVADKAAADKAAAAPKVEPAAEPEAKKAEPDDEGWSEA
ncbi:MAG TPA: hypothetical protein VIK01_19020 [Polyangiaceae bacterium]